MLIEDQSKSQKVSSFSDLPDAPADEIFALNHAYATDAHPDKVNLSMGVYRTEEGQPWPLSSVQQVEEEQYRQNDPARHEYLQIEGDTTFLGLARDLMFGFNSSDPSAQQKEEDAKQRIASVQTISGTGANHIGAAFLTHHLKPKHVWVSSPTWANHHTIWELQGIERKSYPYFNAATCSFDFNGAITTLENEAVEGDVILLHACAHNPTGVDPSKEQWKQIAEVCQRKRLFPFFDSAYQGFASGSADEDAWAVRHFFNMSPPMEMCVAQSFSKNFGLYGQRAGAFHLVTNGVNPTETALVRKNLCHIIRGEYSMGPRYGSSIVKRILGDSTLRAQWQDDLTVMSSRIKRMRQALYDELIRLKTPGSWEHIINQNGMFSYTGLTLGQVLALKNDFHIYLLKSGRASVSGLSEKNVAYVARAIDNAVRKV